MAHIQERKWTPENWCYHPRLYSTAVRKWYYDISLSKGGRKTCHSSAFWTWCLISWNFSVRSLVSSVSKIVHERLRFIFWGTGSKTEKRKQLSQMCKQRNRHFERSSFFNTVHKRRIESYLSSSNSKLIVQGRHPWIVISDEISTIPETFCFSATNR